MSETHECWSQILQSKKLRGRVGGGDKVWHTYKLSMWGGRKMTGKKIEHDEEVGF